MEDKKYFLLYYYKRTADKVLWIHTTFITREEGSAERYLGLTEKTVPVEKINADLQDGSLFQLALEEPIKLGQTVWIAPDHTAYLADAKNPLDPDRKKIHKAVALSTYDFIEEYLLAKLLKAEFNPNDELIESYFSSESWKILLTVCIKLIVNGSVDEQNFITIGYVFARLDPLYNANFKKILNDYGMAFSRGELCFRNKGHEYKRWEIIIDIDTPEKYLTNYGDFTRPNFK